MIPRRASAGKGAEMPKAGQSETFTPASAQSLFASEAIRGRISLGSVFTLSIFAIPRIFPDSSPTPIPILVPPISKPITVAIIKNLHFFYILHLQNIIPQLYFIKGKFDFFFVFFAYFFLFVQKLSFGRNLWKVNDYEFVDTHGGGNSGSVLCFSTQ